MLAAIIVSNMKNSNIGCEDYHDVIDIETEVYVLTDMFKRLFHVKHCQSCSSAIVFTWCVLNVSRETFKIK